MKALWARFRTFILAAVFIVLCQVSFATFVLHQFKAALVERDAVVTQQLLLDDPMSAGTQPSAQTLEDTGLRLVNLPGVVRANVYSTDGFVRFSSEKNLIGIKFDKNTELAEAFAGELHASLSSTEQGGKSEHFGLGGLGGRDASLIEAYIPLHDGTGNIVAVAEYYKQLSSLDDAMQSTDRIVWIITFIAAFGMVAGLLLLMAMQRRG